jgi:hypothetical protein
MGQAAVDLPDPMGLPPAGAAGALGADDLLAQMAGEEIDRLLAEAEKDIAPPPDPQPISSIADDNPPPHESAPAGPEAFEIKREETEGLSNLLDDLLKDAPPEEAAPVAVPAAPAEQTASIESNEIEDIDETLAAEHAALLAPVEAAAPEEKAIANSAASPVPAPAALAAAAEEPRSASEPAAVSSDEAGESLPVWLAPLEWINAPLADCSNIWRELIGKVAILTAINALAVIAYVTFIRRH